MEELFVPSDFETMTAGAKLRNSTSGWSPAESARIELQEIEGGRVTLETPSRSCSEGHHLWLRLSLRVPGERPSALSVDCDARVVSVQACGEGRERVEAVLIQYPRAEWEELRRAISRRQDEVTAFLEATRGRS
jgi:hypothetical protein